MLICRCYLFYFLWAKEIRYNAISHLCLFYFLFLLFIYFSHCLFFANLAQRLDFCCTRYLMLRLLINNKSFWWYQLLSVPRWTQRHRITRCIVLHRVETRRTTKWTIRILVTVIRCIWWNLNSQKSYQLILRSNMFPKLPRGFPDVVALWSWKFLWTWRLLSLCTWSINQKSAWNTFYPLISPADW